ncbi:CAP domain-containing protein [Herpetosiphon llansteffanensis]
MQKLRWGLICLLGLSVWPIQAVAAREQCFPAAQSAYCIDASFNPYWETNGGLAVFGYPITWADNETNADTGQQYLTQWFERNRFEWHPENAGTPYVILLGLLGKDRLQQLGRDPFAEGREAGPRDGCLWFEQTGHNLCDQQAGLGFRSYWEQHGLNIAGLNAYERSLQLFGLPLTAPTMETNASGDTVLTQWFERARFEWHPNNPDQFKVLLGLLGSEILGPAQPQPQGWLEAVNLYRANADLAPVGEDAVLNDNCFQHARYMAENHHLTHDQDPSLPWASPAGQICGSNGNAWLGGGAGWTAVDAVEGWVSSPGHRLWLLYPTTPVFGFGFYRAENGTSAAGLDVLSRTAMDADTSYAGWPIRYPAEAERFIPPSKYPITLSWRYFGANPIINSTTIETSNGVQIAHSASTDLPAGHKGVLLLPTNPLPANSRITVHISGSYENIPFDSRWTFTTSRR